MANPKLPPHNIEAEQSVLGAILIDKEAMGLISSFLAPDDFYDDLNGIIYGAMLSLYEERKPIDILTLKQKLKKNKDFHKIQSSYLTFFPVFLLFLLFDEF